MRLNHLKIGVKIRILACFLLLGMVGTGIVGWRTFGEMRSIDLETMDVATQLAQAIDTARTAQVEFKKQVQEWKDILLRGNDPAAFAKYSKQFAKQSELTQDNLKKLKEQFIRLGLDVQQVDEALATHAELSGKYIAGLAKYDTNNPDSAHVVDKLVKGIDRPATQKVDTIVAYVFDQSKKIMETRAKKADDRYLVGARLQVVVVLLTGMIGGIITLLLIRSIVIPLKLAVDVAEKVAEGDLTSEIAETAQTEKERNETDQLMYSLWKMNDKLLHVVRDVRNSAGTIAEAANEASATSVDLSGRTETQASALEETASSIEELTSTIKQNSDNSQQANKLAQQASEIASLGGVNMSQVVTMIGSINESSRKIVDIISVIDGIAFQTNILALNAAVEAARAGEQGRGFAVVAAEVRSLAQRSASAAKEIKVLIGDSVEKVEAGSKLVDQAGHTMTEIQESIQRVADVVGEISLASREQSQGVQQIQEAIVSMDDVTQQNAVMVDRASISASSLNAQAINLKQVVSMFKLKDLKKRA